jgi:Phosphotransferase enzyme family
VISAGLRREDIAPLASQALRARFPGLADAMNSEGMKARLQQELFDGAWIEAVERPKAELSERTCTLQYPLRVRMTGGEPSSLLVLATMFQDGPSASDHERQVLRPVASGWTTPHGLRRSTAVIDELHLALSVFPVNAALPTLVAATDAAQVTRVLRDVVDDSTVEVDGIELVVFRRTRGCVLRYRLRSERSSTLYGKVGYGASSANEVHMALGLLDGAAPAQRESAPRFPRMLGRSRELEMSLVGEVPGTRPDLRLPDEAERLVDGAAAGAAYLHGSGIRVGGAHALRDEIARVARSVSLLQSDVPALSEWLRDIVSRLAAPREPAAQESVFSHGDFTPSQLLFDGPRLGILDFDKLCQAEPAYDLGRFLAYLRFKLAKYSASDADVLAARFVDAYARASGRPVAAERIRLFEITSLARMAARSWLQLKPARLNLALDVLERIL